MKLGLSRDQVVALAPDAGAVSASKALARPTSWQGLGHNQEALWGECQGSALYQVRIELATFTITCSCPSHKRPCKHGLGLLLLAADPADCIPAAAPPEWVTSWLAKRDAASTRAGDGKTGKEASPAGRANRAEKRLTLVSQGVARLHLWLHDALQRGLLALGEQPAQFWEDQAARLVDAQAPGLASRVRRLGVIDRSAPVWQDRLLGEMGRLALLLEAFDHLDALGEGLQEDVRQMIGWQLRQDEVAARGELVADEWMIVASRVDVLERIHTQRTWLYGLYSGGSALILQHSSGGQAFAEVYPPGMRQHAEVAYWPGAFPQRARIERRRGEMQPVEGALPASAPTIAGFLDQVSAALARQPWLERFLCPLASATPVFDGQEGRWYLRDGSGSALPLCAPPWDLLALSGGSPVDVLAEWNGEDLSPLGVFVGGLYSVVRAVETGRPTACAREKRNPFVVAALTGVASSPTPRTASPADELLAEVAGASPAETLLLRAGAWEVYRVAGYALRSLAELPREQVPLESAQAAPEQSARALAALLQQSAAEGDLHETLLGVVGSGYRLPHGLLTLALARATAEPHLRQTVAAALGERGRWLARLNPAWLWALSASSS